MRRMAKAPDTIRIELLADRPELFAQVGHMTWLEWGHGADLESFSEVIAREAGRDGLPVSLVAVDAAGDAVGKVATGDEAVGFYRRCGWSDAETLRLVATGVPTTILTKRL